MSHGVPINVNVAAELGGAEHGREGLPKTPQQVATETRFQQTQAQIADVVEIMHKNVEKVLERDQKLSELDDKANAVHKGAVLFEKQAGKLTRKFRLKNLKMIVNMGVIGLIFIIIISIVVYVFGGPGNSSISPSDSKTVVTTPSPVTGDRPSSVPSA